LINEREKGVGGLRRKDIEVGVGTWYCHFLKVKGGKMQGDCMLHDGNSFKDRGGQFGDPRAA